MDAKTKIGYKVLAGIAAIIAIVLSLYWTTSSPKDPVAAKADKATRKAVLATGFEASKLTTKHINKSDFGANWPFVPDSGLLVVTPVGGVYFMEDENIYAVNGTARKGVEENPHLLDLPFSVSHRKETNKDNYVSLSGMTDFGLSLIGVYQPKTSYYAPEPMKEPDVKYGLSEAQRKQIFQDLWDEQYNAKLLIAKQFLYQEYSSQQGDLETKKLHVIDKMIMKKYALDEDTYHKIRVEGIDRRWSIERKSFSYSWQLTNSFPE
ncbi:MAG: hypothetical protein HGB19_04560 [Chlorobiales bacterium]|nr:hypothetical protein [Chlorobiales bacterium]